MKLIISPTSPYARKARIVAAEKGIQHETEVVTTLWDNPPASITNNNPLRKIPILLCDDGGVLVDSAVIAEYLDLLDSSAPPLLPANAGERARAKSRDALVVGGMDAFLAIVMAAKVAPNMKDESWKAWLMEKTNKMLDTLEADAASMSASAPAMADISAGCLLGFMDFMPSGPNWRENRPQLAKWWEATSARDSFAATVPKL